MDIYNRRIKIDLSNASSTLRAFTKCDSFEETIEEAINIGVNYGSFIKTIDIVKNMIIHDMPIEDIVKISELSENQILDVCDMLEEL